LLWQCIIVVGERVNPLLSRSGERRRVMLGPFLGTPPPRNDKEKMVAHAVVWVMLILGLLILLLTVALPS
jgi:hypothetical protein